MAGVLEQLFGPQRRSMEHCIIRMSPKALELEAAREILAEVFDIRLSEVDEMIQNRFRDSDKKASGKDHGLWPQELWV